ncbi:MAG: FixH family protein [Acidobacteria bacterium]|nr:FixH family protein [Acidobacteriota bacterium]
MKRALQLFVTLAAVLLVAAAVYVLRARTAKAPTPNASAAEQSMPGMPPTDAPAKDVGPSSTARGDVTIDPRRQQLIGVRTVTVKRETLAQEVRAVGVVRYDETRLADVNLKVEGFIRDLFVDYTGQAITKGQPLFTLYSPDVLTTENEYVMAIKTRDLVRESQLPDAHERADQLIASARQRLALWDLPTDEIRTLEEQRQPSEAVTFRSPATGFVIEKQALQGLHVMPGQSLYKIADLSVVWVEADVYERELPLVRIGQRATVTLDAYPGERFMGRVLYIYPYVDEKTRTNKVRYEFPNRGGRLKPGMYANVELSMPSGMAVLVPTNAVLDSGKEQIVFVAKGDGYFEPRRVTIGRRSGDQIQIVQGVKEGEQVATGATFFLDSESQLRASLQGFEAPQVGSGAVPTQQLDITFHSLPDPAKVGENQFEVMVKDPTGKPVDGADVSLQFFMAAMPTMNMPAMRSEAKLTPAGGGVYRGSGQVMMAGRWDATVTVTRGGQRLGTKQLPVVAK